MSTEARMEALVVDDVANARSQLRGILEDDGWRVTEAESGEQALERIAERRFDVVALDVNMPGMSGLDAMQAIGERDPDVSVVVVTGETVIQQARAFVVRGGAFDLIAKPPDPEHLVGVLAEAARVTRHRRGEPAGEDEDSDLGMVGRSPALEALVEAIRRVAPANGRVLITGENGSGKDLVAQAIHRLSKRAQGPFVKLNCAAIPKDLVESELFGYERGAYTGATQQKKGKLELADKGTLFLDEIGDLSGEAQAKLLRVVETGEVERVGGTRTLQCDVRIVAATNKDLAAAIERGDFRQDLYYRLNALPLHVPALRERRADIVLLATHFLSRFCREEGRPPKHLSDEAKRVLEEYGWPGNVRELRNLMERAAVLVSGVEVEAEDLVPWLESGPGRESGVGLRGEIERREAEAIRRALDSAGWNVTQAAAALGIDRTNLHRKMKRYEIARGSGR